MTSLGPVSLTSQTDSSNYGAYGRAGWINRISPRDEIAASVEVWQLWQRVNGYTDPSVAFNPFDASFATGTDRTNLVKVGGQWTHLFSDSVEANINGGVVQSFAAHSGIVASVTGDGTVTPTMGNPMSGPFLTASRNPFSQAGMNSRGIEPPTMSSTNSKPVSCSAGSGSM